MKYIIDNRIILSRAPGGPLAKYIVRFERAMRGQGMPAIRRTGRFCSRRVSANGLENGMSHYAASPQIIRSSTCVTGLGGCGRAEGTLPRSGICSIFCAMSA